MCFLWLFGKKGPPRVSIKHIGHPGSEGEDLFCNRFQPAAGRPANQSASQSVRQPAPASQPANPACQMQKLTRIQNSVTSKPVSQPICQPVQRSPRQSHPVQMFYASASSCVHKPNTSWVSRLLARANPKHSFNTHRSLHT